LKSTVLILLTTAAFVTAVSGCSTNHPGRATTAPATTETTSPSVSKQASGPDLDLSKFTSDPCQLLKADQLAQLGSFKTPQKWDAPLGPGCRWNAEEVTKGAAYAVALSTKGNTLESMIASGRSEPVFREATVAGYPAFSSDGTNGKGNCSTYVGTSSKDAIVIQMASENKDAPEYQDSCGATEKVAALVIGNLKG
jgi:hypothetical protein